MSILIIYLVVDTERCTGRVMAIDNECIKYIWSKYCNLLFDEKTHYLYGLVQLYSI